MARFLLASLFVAGLASALPAAAQPAMTEEPSAAVKACVVKNAADVDVAFDSLNDASDFLLQKICAAELADQTAVWAEEKSRIEAEEYRASIKAMCEARAKRPPDPDSRNASITGLMCADDDSDLYLSMRGGTSMAWISGFTSAPRATAFAAQTLLQVRKARLKGKQ